MSPELLRQHEEHKQRRLRIASRACEERPNVEVPTIEEKHEPESASVQNDTQSEIKQFKPYLVPRIEPSIYDVIAVCADFYGVKPLDVLSHRRTHDVIRPRHVAMFLSKDMTSNSLPTIGRRFSDRDHTTVLSAFRKIDRQRRDDARLQDEVDLCRIKINELVAGRNAAMAPLGCEA